MAQASSSPRSSAYLDALTQEIEKKLQRALASPSQRRNLLQELFADIALEIDERAKEMILSREEDAISPAEEGIEGQLCFYDVLTDHYVRVPESGKRILDLIVQLWSQSFASHIFALLFHKWLFEVQLDNPEVLLRYSSALVEGATNVFCFTSPGGPMYPTRAVRHAAWDALDLLFSRWQISSACYKPVLPIAIPMVLARFLLEFCNGLREGSIVLCFGINLFKFGEAEKAKVLDDANFEGCSFL